MLLMTRCLEAKQIGQSRLQAVLTSMIPRHVLGVLGADPAVVRAALGDLGLALERLGAGLAETLDVEIALGIAVDDGLEPAVVWARPAEDHATALDDELAENRPGAGRSTACAPARALPAPFRRWLRYPVRPRRLTRVF